MKLRAVLLAVCLAVQPWLSVPPAGAAQEKAEAGETSLAFSEGMVTISFDDGWRSQYEAALPVLEEAGLKATFYINTEPPQKGWRGFMTPDQIKDLAAKGHEIGGHTITHTNLAQRSSRDAQRELTVSKQYLEELIGRPVTSLAYPYGGENSRVEALAAEAGYTSARWVRIGDLVTPATNPMKLNAFLPTRATKLEAIGAALEEAKTKKRWLILVFHKIGGGGRFSFSPETLKEAAGMIKASGIRTVTVSEGVALMKHTGTDLKANRN